MPLNCVTMRLKDLSIIEQQGKTLNNQNPKPKRWNSKSLWALLGLVQQPTCQGRNLVKVSLFGMYDTLLERYLWVLQDFPWAYCYFIDLKKHRLGGQNYNGSLGHEKMLKIINVTINKENDEINWRSRWNRRVATNIHLDPSSLLRKKWSPLHAKPPWGEEISVEPGPSWTTFPGEGVGLFWKLDIIKSFFCECSWSVCPWSDHLWLVPCILGLISLMWVVLQC